MAIIKCKMCGGDLIFSSGDTYGTCEYCGSVSTIPRSDDENRLNRCNRANHFRRQCDFDKALTAYEKLPEQDDTDAEAHWGAAISRYGIEHVEDPAGRKRIPACHRAEKAAAAKKRAVIIVMVLLLIAAGAGWWAYQNVIVLNNNYKAAAALMEAGKYTEAITAFKAMNGHKDSAAQIAVCETAIKEQKYVEATALMEAGKYTEAITAFKAMNGYKDSAAQIAACETGIKEQKYAEAAALMEAEKYTEAYAVCLQLRGYKDIDTLLATDENLKAAAVAAARESFTQVGNIVTYGHYEQDNNTGNGKEAVEWIVVKYDSTNGKALLLSRYGLDAHRFDAGKYQGWDKSEIRTWLNSTFLNAAFTSEEQPGIATTTVKTGNNAEWVAFAKKKSGNCDSLEGGADTQDKIFLLSLEEAMEYGGYSTLADFCNNGTDKMKATPTAYAVAQGAYQSSSNELNGTRCCVWWLRSPGYRSDYASLVSYDGSLYFNYVHNPLGSVRPAFWLNLDSTAIY